MKAFVISRELQRIVLYVYILRTVFKNSEWVLYFMQYNNENQHMTLGVLYQSTVRLLVNILPALETCFNSRSVYTKPFGSLTKAALIYLNILLFLEYLVLTLFTLTYSK